jgi:hypothetical protein
MEYVYATFAGMVQYGPTGAVEMNVGDVWYADDPFVVARKDLFSETPVVVRSVVGRPAPAPTPLGGTGRKARARG